MNDVEPTLYGTSACHLCEEASAMLEQLHLAYRFVDIAGDDDLQERYGIRIPVLRRADGEELGWPFQGADVRNFLRSASA